MFKQRKNKYPLTQHIVDSKSLEKDFFTLIDVGCSQGIIPFARLFEPYLKAHAFDVIEDEITRLINLEKNKNVKYYLSAMGLDKNHQLMLKKGDKDYTQSNPWNRLSASLASNFNLKKDNHKIIDRSINHSISTFVKENEISDVDFIKIDIDGNDFMALVSCEDILNKFQVLGLYLEVNFYGTDKEYEHTFHNTDRYLRKFGYDLYDLNIRHYSNKNMPAPFVTKSFAHTKTGRPYQGMALYIKDPLNHVNKDFSQNITLSKLFKLMSIYEIFSLPGCAAEIIKEYRHSILQSIDANYMLDLLTPDLNNKILTYKEYIEIFNTKINLFFPKNNFMKRSVTKIYNKVFK